MKPNWKQTSLGVLCVALLVGGGILSDAGAQTRFARRSGSATQRNRARPQSSAQQSQARRSSQSRNDATQRRQSAAQSNAQTQAAFRELIRASWIWSPAHEKDEVPVGDCYFRKVFHVGVAEVAQVQIACDNRYELYVNGQLVGEGNDWRNMDVHDIVAFLRPGKNVVAVRATNVDAGPAGLVARVLLKETGGGYQSYSTDDTWRTSVKFAEGWQLPSFPDRQWLPAKDYGALGTVLPWGDEIVIAGEGAHFALDAEFRIERLIKDRQAGSLIAMTFSAEGDILASQEGGPLLLIRDGDGDGTFESVTTFCEKLRNVQGILSLGGRVFAVGEGPDGAALYRLADQDHDGHAEEVRTLLRFQGAGEHGPHALQMGPEGLLYIVVGNFSQVAEQPRPSSPYANAYEGDLVQPRYEDPRGHAVGVAAPGGCIVRTDFNGSFVELVAGGFRNPYDFAFNEDGELINYDADMEWDKGTPWYRPTRINHVPPGAELGWRSGWAKWPEYYLDSLPATLDMGAGSPTGVEFYQHVAFPKRFHNVLFACDWALGEIHAVEFERRGATYTAKSSLFLRGQPLNVTDLAVGPDGSLYFCTGGRGTDGGIYRVSWKGNVPPEATYLGHGIQRALRQPQFDSDWARARIAAVKRELGSRWDTDLVEVVGDPRQATEDRLRAIDLLAFFGPPPASAMLLKLSHDREPRVRQKVTRMMGVRNSSIFTDRLAELLSDPDALVRRIACESVARRGDEGLVEPLVRLLGDDDRYVAFSARRALEKVPTHQWKQEILASGEPRLFLNGAVALLTAEPTRDNALDVVRRCTTELRGGRRSGSRRTALSDADFLDLLRVTQLALDRGDLAPEEVDRLSQQLLLEYPSSDYRMNRELVKLLVYLGPPEAAHALVEQLAADLPAEEKFHIGAYAPRLRVGWQPADKVTLLRYYEQIRELEGGHSLSAYVENFARDFFTNLTLAERRQVIGLGERFPTSTLSILAKLSPEELDEEMLAAIRALDQRLEEHEGDVYDRLRVGIVAVLGSSSDSRSHAYLRQLFETHPERRAPVAMSLTQHPSGKNWDTLVESLKSIDGVAAQTVMASLRGVDRRPETAEAYRYVILQALRLGTNGGDSALRLLEHWTGQRLSGNRQTTESAIATWQDWYAKEFPDALPAELPQESQQDRWTYDELLSFLESAEGKSGDVRHGAQVFHEAECIKCHRFGNRGEGVGPDLTTASNRFRRREILESILFPSHVISDQYSSHVVVANGAVYLGIIAQEDGDSLVMLTSEGEKVRLRRDDVEDVRTSTTSAMPAGLLNRLTLQDIADLFAFLTEADDAPSQTADRPSWAPARQ